MLGFAQPLEHKKVAELGSGDGRVVKAFAQQGAIVHGFEINPLLSFWSRYNLRKVKGVKIFSKSYWNVNLSEYDIIIVFGMTHIMNRLRIKFENELKPGTLVISNIFQIPGWVPTKEEGGVRVYVKR